MENKYHLDFYFHGDEKTFGSTKLLQLGRLHFSYNGFISEHAHGNLFELTSVTDGKGEIYSNGIATSVEPGDVYFSLPGDFHKIVPYKNELFKYDYFAFRTDHPILSNEFSRIWTEGLPPTHRVFRSAIVQDGIAEAISELSEKPPFYEHVLAILFERILFATIRALQTENNVPFKKYLSNAEELCYQLMYYIDTHIYSLEKLDELSKTFSYNYSYLSALFKKTTGDSLQRYFQNRKIKTAKLLLAEGKLKAVEIAELLRYGSLYSFSKAFKSACGVSPKYFRAENLPSQT